MAGPQETPFVHYRIEVDPQNFSLVGEEDESKYYTTLDLSLEVTDRAGLPVLTRDKEIYIELTPSEIQGILAHAGSGCPLGPCRGCPHNDVKTGACMA